MRLAVLLVLFAGCAGVTPEIQHRAGIRREAADRLEHCLGWGNARRQERKRCILESAQYCQARGMDSSCAVDELWAR